MEGITVRAVGFDDLIRLKRESGRDGDLEDVATLLAAHRGDTLGGGGAAAPISSL